MEEYFDPDALRVFLRYVADTDVQILANRREAARLFQRAISAAEGRAPEHTFSFPSEKADKVFTHLASNETMRGDTVSVYAFVRLVGDMRRSLAASHPTPVPSPAPSGGAGGK